MNIFLKKGIALALCLTCTTVLAQSTLYKWKDKEGKWVYADHPPEKIIGVQKIGTTSGVAKKVEGEEAAGVNIGHDKAKKLFPVTLFASGACADTCDKAKAFLSERQIPFALKDPGRPENFEEFKKTSPNSMAPAIRIGDSSLVGFSEAAWANALEDAGYARDPIGKK